MSSEADFDANGRSEDSNHALYGLQRSNSVAQHDANNMFRLEKLTFDLRVPAVDPTVCSTIKPTVQKPTAG